MIAAGTHASGSLMDNAMWQVGGFTFFLKACGVSASPDGKEVLTLTLVSGSIVPQLGDHPSPAPTFTREDFEREVQWRVASEVQDRIADLVSEEVVKKMGPDLEAVAQEQAARSAQAFLEEQEKRKQQERQRGRRR